MSETEGNCQRENYKGHSRLKLKGKFSSIILYALQNSYVSFTYKFSKTVIPFLSNAVVPYIRPSEAIKFYRENSLSLNTTNPIMAKCSQSNFADLISFCLPVNVQLQRNRIEKEVKCRWISDFHCSHVRGLSAKELAGPKHISLVRSLPISCVTIFPLRVRTVLIYCGVTWMFPVVGYTGSEKLVMSFLNDHVLFQTLREIKMPFWK